MSQIISITNDVRQTFTTVLNGQRTRFNFYYIDENRESLIESGWYGDCFLSGLTDESIVRGVRLTTFISMVQNLITNFSGGVYVIPLTSPPKDLTGRAPWGDTHQLVYFTQEEIDDATI